MSSVLYTRKLSKRPTGPIRNHNKGGLVLEYLRRRGYNLVEKPPTLFELYEPTEVIPEGTKIVRVYCFLETLNLPASVDTITIEEGGFIKNVPAVRSLEVNAGGSIGVREAVAPDRESLNHGTREATPELKAIFENCLTKSIATENLMKYDDIRAFLATTRKGDTMTGPVIHTPEGRCLLRKTNLGMLRMLIKH